MVEQVRTVDGRSLEVLLAGPSEGFPLVFHHGTPQGAAPFVTLGWSGGGPRAIACPALLPGRCRAAASGAGEAPAQAEGLDFMAGMGPENVEEFSAARAGPEAIEAWLAKNAAPTLCATADQLVDDDLALVRPWGFDLGAVSTPVSVWQRGEDRMVPYAHGVWLAEHVAGARAHTYPDEGHLSLVTQMGRILDDLLEQADLDAGSQA